MAELAYPDHRSQSKRPKMACADREKGSTAHEGGDAGIQTNMMTRCSFREFLRFHF